MTTNQKGEYDPEVLRNLYWVDGLSIKQIAERYGVHQKTIWSRFKKYGIDRRGCTNRRRVNYLPYRNRVDGYCSWSADTHTDGCSTVYVHQLLAIANGADPHKVFSDGEYQVHHKNGVKWDNRPENIEVLTQQEHRSKHDYNYGTKERKYTNEELLEWIDAFVYEFGVVPTLKDASNWPGPSEQVYRDRFGGWKEAVRKAGYTARGERQ